MELEVGNGNVVLKWLSGNQLHKSTALEIVLLHYNISKIFVKQLLDSILLNLLLTDIMNFMVAQELMENIQYLLITGWISGI